MTSAVGNESTIHGSVVDASGRWILGGVYAPGDLLPRWTIWLKSSARAARRCAIDRHSGALTFTGQFVPVGAPVTMTFLS